MPIIKKPIKKATSKKTKVVKQKIIEEESSSSDGYENSDGEYVEKPKYYRLGGYHPVQVGEEYNQKYTIKQKLGFGHFSTVWLVEKKETEEKSALKIVKSAKVYTEQAIDEIKLMTKMNEMDPERKENVVHILDNFTHDGPNGKHICMNIELGGSNLLDLIKYYDYKGIPMDQSKMISREVLKALDFIHTKCGIIHTDIKPENILLSILLPKGIMTKDSPQLPPYTIKLADFGNANWVNKRFTDDISTLEYRSPEVILGLHWGCPTDVWSHGCMIFEILTGDYLFKPKSSEDFSRDEDHLAQMMELLGIFPQKYLKGAPHFNRHFKANFQLRHIPHTQLQFWKTKNVLIEKYKMKEDDATVISSLIESMLIYDENKRLTAKQCLEHPWFIEN